MTRAFGLAPAAHAPPQPTLTLETELPDQDEYEVRIYDERHGRRLVAAIELNSPVNKDRPESRRAFVGKVAGLLQHNVCVSLVNVVTIRQFNLYAELLEFIGGKDPALERVPPCLRSRALRTEPRFSEFRFGRRAAVACASLRLFELTRAQESRRGRELRGTRRGGRSR